MYSNLIKGLVKDHHVLMAYSLSYASQLKMSLPCAVSHMADGLLEDILLY